MFGRQIHKMPELTEVEKTAPVEAKPVEQPQQSAESSTDSSDEEIPELEDAGAANATGAAFPGASAAGLPVDMVSKAKQSRGEKKARKIMSKLGLKPVSCVAFYVCPTCVVTGLLLGARGEPSNHS